MLCRLLVGLGHIEGKAEFVDMFSWNKILLCRM